MSFNFRMEGIEGNSRRRFFIKCARGGSAFFAGMVVLNACGRKKNIEQETSGHDESPVVSCDDLSHISQEDMAVRKKLGYVKESPIADNHCQNCNLYLPPKADQTCGGCMLFKGPVYPSSYCTYWAPKV